MFGKHSKQDRNAPPPSDIGERSVSRWLVMLSVLYVIAGIMMLVWPHLTTDMLGSAAGISLLVFGLANIIIYFTKDHLNGILQMDLTEGVIAAAFGAFMLMHKDFVAMALPFGAGILLLIGGISHIQYALDMRRLRIIHWYVMLFFAVVLLILGTILIYNPFKETALIYFVAVSLILNGILTVISVLSISHRAKMIRSGKIPPEPLRKKLAEKTKPVNETVATPTDTEEAVQTYSDPNQISEHTEIIEGIFSEDKSDMKE